MLLKIPYERIAVLIGKNGEVKHRIEKALNVKLKIDSSSGNIEISLNDNNTDPSCLLKAENIVKAIGRGFSPERATRLLDDNCMLDIIDLRDYFGKNENTIRRIKGRVIGKEGKARRVIEETTNAYISVYGHTIAIIGTLEQINLARQAIEMLIQGAQHSTVYKFLFRRRRELKKSRYILWEDDVQRIP